MKLTPEIQQIKKLNEEINSGAKNIMAKVIKTGELLSKVKAGSKYGDWNDVLQAVQMSRTTAHRYMSVWERRSTIDISEVKTLSDAFKLLSGEQTPTCSTMEQPTSQNELLTHEKTQKSETEKRPVLGREMGDLGTARATAKEIKTRPSSFDPDEIPRDNSWAYVSGPAKPETNGAPKAPEVRTDKEGYPIPESLLPEWDRATNQAMGWIREFDAIHRQVMNLHGKDFALARINKASLESLHSNYRETLKQAVPYAVCVVCQGKNPDRCKECNPNKEDGKGVGLGWVNKHFWENCEREDLKTVRRKSYGINSPSRLSA